MHFIEPLNILAEYQEIEITQDNLSKIEKQILAKLSSENNNSIFINNEAYKRDDILKTFNELKINLELYQQIFENHLLRKLLLGGDLMFFMDKSSQNNVHFNENTKTQINNKIITKVQSRLIEIVMDNNEESNPYLANIIAYLERIDKKQKDKALQPLKEKLHNHITYLKERIHTPFETKQSRKFSADVIEAVNINLFRSLQKLPESFNEIKENYCNWCLDSIVTPAFFRDSNFRYYSVQEHKIILKALRISAPVDNRESNLNNIRLNEKRIKGKTNLKKIIIGKLLILLVFIAVTLISKLTTSKIDAKTDQKSITAEPAYNPKSRSIVGGKLDKSSFQLIDQEIKNDTIFINYKSNFFPTNFEIYNELINDINYDHTDKVAQHYVIKNTNNEFDLEYKYGITKSKKDSIVKLNNSIQDKLNLHIKNLDDENFNFQGILNTSSSKESFQIKYEPKSQLYIASLTKKNQSYSFQKKGNRLLITDVAKKDEYAKRFIAIISNILILKNMYLEQNKRYSLNAFKTYSVNPKLNKTDIYTHSLKASLKYKLLLEENITICQAHTEDYEVRYFIDKDGHLKTMQIGVCDNKGEFCETIILSKK